MLGVVTALAAEALPLVRSLDLERANDSRYPIYRGNGVELIVSGIGAIAAASAVGYLAGCAEEPIRAWMNVGIGGHRDLELGAPRLAHKVVHSGSGRVWYPPLVFDPPCPGATIRTVDDIQFDPPDDAIYEMEAAGFYAAALRFSTSETIQVLKVVSDNRRNPPDALTAERVERMIEANLLVVEALVAATSEIAGELAVRQAPPLALAGFLDSWHFTVTQRRQLDRLLRRHAALRPGIEVESKAFGQLDSARAVLAELGRQL